MMKLNNGGKLPNKFKIANQENNRNHRRFSFQITITVIFCDATNTIKLARAVKSEYEGNVSMSYEQLRNTFYHELFHVFQFYYNNEFNEIQALSICYLYV